jgi:hypothetical protein
MFARLSQIANSHHDERLEGKNGVTLFPPSSGTYSQEIDKTQMITGDR